MGCIYLGAGMVGGSLTELRSTIFIQDGIDDRDRKCEPSRTSKHPECNHRHQQIVSRPGVPAYIVSYY